MHTDYRHAKRSCEKSLMLWIFWPHFFSYTVNPGTHIQLLKWMYNRDNHFNLLEMAPAKANHREMMEMLINLLSSWLDSVFNLKA